MPLKRALTGVTASLSLALAACGDGAEQEAPSGAVQEAAVQPETKWG
jgi:hypothetical protein